LSVFGGKWVDPSTLRPIRLRSGQALLSAGSVPWAQAHDLRFARSFVVVFGWFWAFFVENCGYFACFIQKIDLN
jgi:hypothetical protein